MDFIFTTLACTALVALFFCAKEILPSPSDGYIECEGCDAMVPEDQAIPIADGTIDWTPKVCRSCAGPSNLKLWGG